MPPSLTAHQSWSISWKIKMRLALRPFVPHQRFLQKQQPAELPPKKRYRNPPPTSLGCANSNAWKGRNDILRKFHGRTRIAREISIKWFLARFFLFMTFVWIIIYIFWLSTISFQKHIPNFYWSQSLRSFFLNVLCSFAPRWANSQPAIGVLR